MAKWIDSERLRRGALTSLVCLATAMAAFVLASCGSSDDSGTSTAARRVVPIQSARRDRWTYARARFNEMCAGCHTLADAGARGPRFNLDHGGNIEADHVRAVLRIGEPGMPPWRGVLSKREFEELVAYVSTVAQRSPGEDEWGWQIKLREEGEYWPRKPGERFDGKEFSDE